MIRHIASTARQMEEARPTAAWSQPTEKEKKKEKRKEKAEETATG